MNVGGGADRRADASMTASLPGLGQPRGAEDDVVGPLEPCITKRQGSSVQ